ncbi:sialidase family protein [Phytoactinopolyspora halotolerans]|uniref:Exo-alpha-sialidase n=1 Tax=Phytoactinopolyspora halotolerans TaxID=1981512 RepID=A0A6L9SH97_9ACTN|nr:sialidase family protein [Phytoactinopolyspora halotolerans]NEE03470.1 exo-alpha-sialidase [Phytoactinopolyspora halotolerans]
MRRTTLIAAASSLLLAMVAPALAGPFTTGSVVQVSGTSPFDATCGMTPDGGSVFLDSEVEPWVDVSPTDSDIVAGMWQQDRWSNGGSRGNVAGISVDGGTTWQIVAPPNVSECTGGEFDRASDPWVSFAPNGDLHLMHLVLDITPPPGRPGGFGENGMMVQMVPAQAFADGVVDQAEFSEPILIAFNDEGKLHDKNSLTADPTDADLVYAVWDFLDIPPGALIRPDRAVALGFKGAALFSRTTDGGQTWSEPEVLYNPGGINQTIGNQIVVNSDGVLFNFFNEILNFRNDDRGNQFEFNMSLKFSPDKGETWLPRGRPIRFGKIMQAPVTDPDTGEPHRTADVLFDVAVDENSGNLYAVWQDRRFTGVSAVAFTMSTDDGRTWTAPVRVDQTPPDPGNALNQQAFLPSVHVADDGTVAVTYYDFRNNGPGGGTDTDHWFVHCHAATVTCSDPANWNAEVHVAGPFDARQAPFAGGYFLGDYVGLSNAADTFTPFFTQTTATDPANQYYTEVSPAP